MTEVLDRIRGAMVGLKMPRALEALDLDFVPVSGQFDY